MLRGVQMKRRTVIEFLAAVETSPSQRPLHPDVGSAIVVVDGDLAEVVGAVQLESCLELRLSIETHGAAAEAPGLLEAGLQQPLPQPLPTSRRAAPHALELGRTRLEDANGRRAHDVTGSIHDEQECPRAATVLLFPVSDVVVEAVGVHLVPDESQVRHDLARDRRMVLPAGAPDGETPGHVLLRAWEARPRSQRYSFSPPFFPTHRDSTKRRSLSRLT